jgi:hypothetical protein
MALLSAFALCAACTELLGNDFSIVPSPGQGGSSASGSGSGGSAGSGEGGGGPPPTVSYDWSVQFGDVGDDNLAAIATDDNGQIVLVGSFSGSLVFGRDELQADNVGAFVAKLDEQGEPLWAIGYGGGDTDVHQATAVAIDEAGDIVVTGFFDGTGDFGGPLTLSNGIDAFIVKLTANGGYVESLTFSDAGGSGPDPQYGRAVATGLAGSIVLVGEYTGSVSVFLEDFTSEADTALFMAVFDSGLVHLASESYGLVTTNRARALTADASGIFLTGEFDGYQLPLANNHNQIGGTDIFVARFNANAVPVWSRSYGSRADDHVYGIGLAPAGDVLAIAGSVGGAIDFGGGALPFGGALDAAAAAFSSNDGHVFSVAAGDPEVQEAAAVAFGATGTVYVAGNFVGGLDWGGEPASGAEGDLFLSGFGSDGTPYFSKRLVGTAGPLPPAQPVVAATPDGGVIVATSFQEELDVGGRAPLESLGANDIVVAKFAPATGP